VTRNNPRRLTTIMGLMAVGVLVAGCGAGGRPEGGGESAASDVGVTENTVTVGTHMPLTGVAAPGYSEIPTGTRAYFDYVNAHGGVDGRKIEYIVKDDAYDPTKTSQVTNELVLQDQIFAMVGGLGTPTHSAVVDFLNSEQVPDLSVSSGSRQWGDNPQAKPYTFGWQPDYELEGKVIGQWISQNMPDARVGLFLQDDDFGDDGEKGVRRYIDDQIVAEERYTSGSTDVAPQIAALQSANVDVVLGFNTPSYTALSQLVALKLNFEPQWFYSNVGSDPTLVGSLLSEFSEGEIKDGSTMLDGVLTTEYLAGVDTPNDPWVQLWQKVWDANGSGGPLTNYRIYGMAEAYTFVQALQAAGPNPTREGIVNALEQIGAELEGPPLAAYRYSEESHLGVKGLQVSRLEGTTAEPITPVLVSDIGAAPIEEDDSGAKDAPPPDGIPDVQPVS
jgi:branched-chain amino acid transport system substrate-binding protein